MDSNGREEILWEDVKREAYGMFTIWMQGRELEWADLAWESLRQNGLTT